MTNDTASIFGIVLLLLLVAGIFAGTGLTTAYIDGAEYSSSDVSQSTRIGDSITTSINSDITYGSYGTQDTLTLYDGDDAYADAHMRENNNSVYLLNDVDIPSEDDTNHIIASDEVDFVDGTVPVRDGDLAHYYETPSQGEFATVGVLPNTTTNTTTYYLHHAERTDSGREYNVDSITVDTDNIISTHKSTHGYVVITVGGTYVFTDRIYSDGGQYQTAQNNQIVGIDNTHVYTQGGSNNLLNKYNYKDGELGSTTLTSGIGGVSRIDYDATRDRIIVGLDTLYTTEGSVLSYTLPSGYNNIDANDVHSGLNSVYITDVDVVNNTVTQVSPDGTSTINTADISEVADVHKTNSNYREYDVSIQDGEDVRDFTTSVSAYQTSTTMISDAVQFDAEVTATHTYPNWEITISYPAVQNNPVSQIISYLPYILLTFILIAVAHIFFDF